MLFRSGLLSENDNLICTINALKWTEKIRASVALILNKFCLELDLKDIQFSIGVAVQQNWNRLWEKSIKRIEVCDNIVIMPSWKKPLKKDKSKIILRIDPKMSFGTGHHETTRLCLRALEKFVTYCDSILDFGAGTGILSVAAIKLGASKSIAIDNDEWTVGNLFENIKINKVQRKVTPIFGGINKVPKTKFHLIIANIDFPTIKKNLSHLLKFLHKNGILILSGLLTSDEKEINKLGAELGIEEE